MELDSPMTSRTLNYKYIGKRSISMGLLVLLIFLSISFAIRYKDFNQVTGVQNLEATYHVILTIKSLKSSPIENHWFLPTISLGGENDKGIPWGATVPTKTGDHVYTSFAPPGFLAPYFALGLFNAEPSEKNLAYFNFSLGSAVSIVLFLLLIKVLKYGDYSRLTVVSGAIVGTVISIFSKEVLQSHGLVYWSQSLYQLILISSLYFLFSYLIREKEAKSRNYDSYLIVTVFLGAWTEWTGYFFGVGVAILFWFGAWINRPEKKLSIKLILAVVAAGLLTLIHYGLAVGFDPAIKAFIGRFLVRSTSAGSFLGLLNGLSLSFGSFIVITCVALTHSFFRRYSTEKENSGLQEKLAFLFVSACIPLFENLIMLQHATQFSFDRLKFLFPAALIISIAFVRLSNFWRFVLVISLVFASFQEYKSYRTDLSNYSKWGAVDIQNKYLFNSISKEVGIDCSVFLSNIGVRGYANSLLNRGMYENMTKDDSMDLIKKRHACSAIYIEGSWAYADLPHYNKAWITKPDGSTIKLEMLDEGLVDNKFFLTDSNCINGIAKNWTGFFVPSTEKFSGIYKPGRKVRFPDGDARRIIRTERTGEYLNVFLDGDQLKSEKVGLPTMFVVIDDVKQGSGEGK